VVALGLHVDYWDHQGWRDPFDQKAFTRRQQDYATALKVPDIYTPQIIVDGHEELVGGNRAAIQAALARAAAGVKAPVRLTWTGAQLAIAIDAHPVAANAGVWLAITEDGLTSDVKRGENQGHVLKHAAVTRQLRSLGKTDKTGAFATSTSVSFDGSWKRERLHVVVFAQRPGPGKVVAVGTVVPHT
jgi:hypothetical protein